MTAARSPEPAHVAERAYSIWEEEGRPHGRDRAHWERAEQELATPARAALAAEVPATAESAPAAEPVAKKPTRARKAVAADGTAGPAPKRTRKAADDGAPAAPKRAPRAKKPTTAV